MARDLLQVHYVVMPVRLRAMTPAFGDLPCHEAHAICVGLANDIHSQWV